MVVKGKRWRRLVRALAAIAVPILLLFLLLRTLGATSEQLDRLMVLVGIVGLAPWAVQHFYSLWGRDYRGATDLTETADKLTREVLSVEGETRRKLLDAGRGTGSPANLSYQSEHLIHWSRGAVDYLENVQHFYDELKARRMVILGPPGAGKTVLALQLLCDLAEYRQRLDETEQKRTPVPVRFELSNWNTSLDTKNIKDWLAMALTERYASVTKGTARGLIESGLILPILEGLDEMDSPGEEPDRARSLIDHLNRSVIGSHSLPVVVTCREEEYRLIQEEISVANSRIVIIESLPEELVRSYMADELGAANDRPALQRWEALLKHPDNRRIFELLKTPWALTLMVAFLRDNDDDEATKLAVRSGESEREYQDRVWELLLDQYIPARTRASNRRTYRPDQVERWTTALAHNLGEEVDIRLAKCWRVGGPDRVRSVHIMAVIILLLFINAVALGGLIDVLAPLSLAAVTVIASFILIFLLLLLAAVASTGNVETGPLPKPMSLSSLRTPGAWWRFTDGVGIGLAAGLLFDLASLLAQILRLVPGSGVGGWTQAGFMIGILLGVKQMVSGGGNTITPGSVVYSDLANWLLYMLAGFLAGARATGVLESGLAFGISLGLAAGSGQLWLRYTSGRIIAAWKQLLPLRLNRFFSWAVDAGVMRRSGPAYQFRHLSLRDHLRNKPLRGAKEVPSPEGPPEE